ncbi:hypothetical protein FIU86_11410 [Roseovarius sp. THAF9]|uniref:hypothetical protein n=1 Tax=Roseovarius sp. THAF9 TaxID=2587847 RepID=UPI001267DDE4|nr:hypothetical protein [Roseovarius sp. THAF9]QFT93449.1 hypothetical protein FIU86_11410 [Roseovarius sp. THAF9]
MQFFRPFLVLGLLGPLAACGNTVPEQALFGGAAGTGAAAVVGGSLLTGAAVGAAGNVAFCQVYPEKCL